MLDAGEWCVVRMRGEALGQKAAPVVGDNGAEIVPELREGVGSALGGCGAADREKLDAEVVQRFLAMRELADGGVGIEPQQLTFGVIVLAATPVAVVLRVAAQNLCRNR